MNSKLTALCAAIGTVLGVSTAAAQDRPREQTPQTQQRQPQTQQDRQSPQPQQNRQVQQGRQTQQQDQTFLREAIAGDLAEVELGKLAQEKGQSAEVREYGRKLVADHEKAMRQATQAAEAEGVTPPRQPMPDAQREYERLSRLSGAEFDREFVKLMTADHAKHIEKFRAHASADAGPDSEATEHAKETLPTLEEHLEIAQSLDGTVRR